jgi:hypothetical protein
VAQSLEEVGFKQSDVVVHIYIRTFEYRY